MIKYILIICIISVCFSCKKDPVVNAPTIINATTTTQDTMLPLAVGNYWIYQKSQDDSIGTYTMQNDLDSLYIERDSVILGNQYFKFKHTNHNFADYFAFNASINDIWIKDSLGFLITYPRITVLDPVNLRDTIYRFSSNSGVPGYFCLVPDTFVNRNFVIGQFSGLWAKGYSFNQPPFAFRDGQHYFNAYVANIGLVRMRWTFEACPYLCRFSQHLIRYHLN